MQLSYPHLVFGFVFGFFWGLVFFFFFSVLGFYSIFPASKLEGREAFIFVMIEIIDYVFHI